MPDAITGSVSVGVDVSGAAAGVGTITGAVEFDIDTEGLIDVSVAVVAAPPAPDPGGPITVGYEWQEPVIRRISQVWPVAVLDEFGKPS